VYFHIFSSVKYSIQDTNKNTIVYRISLFILKVESYRPDMFQKLFYTVVVYFTGFINNSVDFHNSAKIFTFNLNVEHYVAGFNSTRHGTFPPNP